MKIFEKKGFTFLIIMLIIVGSGIAVTFYLVNNYIKIEATKLFEKADEKIREFDELDNVLSKQELEKEVIALLDDVIVKYPKTTSGKRALFYKGYILYNTEKYDEAIKQFKLFVSKFSNHILCGKAYYLLSYCYTNKNDNDNAIKSLKVFEGKLKESYYAPLGLYRLGSIFEMKGDKVNAVKYYKKIIDEYSDSSQKKIAQKKMLILKNDIEL